jgi:histidyl-tRNA synthetase
MRDLTSQEMARFRFIEEVFRNVCSGWGYSEVRTPTVEHLHLFTLAGTLSPQMLGRVYSFLDWDGWSGERVVLRPDSTIPVARMFVEQEAGAVQKLFYVQNVFRFAEGDESRESWQCGIELIGDTQPMGDVELLLIADEVLQALGLKPVLKLSDPGIMRAVLTKAGHEPGEQLRLYDRLLEGELQVLDEVAQRIPGAGGMLSALLAGEGDGAAYIDNVRSALVDAIPELDRPLSELAAISTVLAGLGRAHSIAPLLVRNFEYYTGPAFHFYAGDQEVAAGGRYDGLIALVGGRSTPASGLALDMEALISLVASRASDPSLLAVRGDTSDQAALTGMFALAGALRAAGVAFRLGSASDSGDTPEAVATADGFTLRLNGAEPQSFAVAGDVVRALFSGAS